MVTPTLEEPLAPQRTPRRRRKWFPLALVAALTSLALGFGVVRLVELSTGAEIVPDNERFFASPIPVVLHILGVSTYVMLGAFQFLPKFRRRRPQWHRRAGWISAVAGITAAITGMWMSTFYPWQEGEGVLLYLVRMTFGAAMGLSIVLGLRAAVHRNFGAHSAWMLRGYALALGPGSQILTEIFWEVVAAGRTAETSTAFLAAAGWIINLVVAERFIQRRNTIRPSPLQHRVAT